ncbi:TPA: hypothetical protein ACH3X3_007111 [Trebouxia sp. C0006]
MPPAESACAERGNCQLLASVYESAEQAKGSWQTRQDFLNAPGSKGQTLLMTSCCNGHLECVTYLLSKGADVMATNPKGETCLHIAAKNGHSSCVVRLLSSRINTPGAATRLADLVFTEGMEEVKYMDLHNLAGMTALHVAALNGSAATVQAVMANGASVDAQITGSNLTPWLSRGSTALHIAAARGFHAVVDVLLAAQTPDSGLDLRRIRNHRGLKPFQLARANGHSSIARQLCDTHPRRAPRVRRHRDAEGGGGGGAAGGSRKATTPEALLTMLIQRAKLLLTLKAMSSAPAKGLPGGMSLLAVCTNGQSQESKVEQAAAEVLECSEAWRKGGPTAKPASSILRLLGALDELPAAAMLNASYAMEGNAEKAKSNSSYASAAMVQAALNAMASSASADPVEASSTSLTPTTPLAAAVILQAALRSLAGSTKRSGGGGGGHSRRSRQGTASVHDTPASSPRAPHTSRGSLDNQRPVTGPGLNTPARGPTAAPLKTSNQSHQQQHQPATPRTPRSHPPAPLPTPPQGLSSNAWSRPAAEVESPPDRLQAQSVPATPEPAAESGGNGAAFGGKPDFGWTQPGQHPESVGRGVGPSPAGQSQQQILLPAVLPALARQSLTSQGQAKFRALPSAEAIDALCDMSDGSHHAESAKAASQLHQTAAYQQEMAPSSSLAPVLTNSAAAAYNESADTPSYSGGQAAHINGASVVQHTSSSQYKQGSSMQAHPHTLSSQYEAPESSMPYPQSFRMPSECDSSAYDEGGSSTLIHSISNEEQIMREMLEEGNDDMSCDIVMDSQQHDRDDEGPGSRAEQLNTLELHGILGQHGYMLPDLAGEQEEEEESDGDDDADGDDNDDLDDDEEDEETDEASDKGLFKTMPSRRRGDNDEDEGLCSICMDRPLEAQIAGCDHQMCLQCAYQMCARGLTSPLCPFCRGPINTFQPVQK